MDRFTRRRFSISHGIQTVVGRPVFDRFAVNQWFYSGTKENQFIDPFEISIATTTTALCNGENIIVTIQRAET